jgi:hypothetical protein
MLNSARLPKRQGSRTGARMSYQEPNRETWKALYEAASRFQALQCWEWMQDSDIFGIQNPANGEIGYCSIMGLLHEHFALAVYLGTDGLEGLKEIGLRDMPADPLTVLVSQKCLMASFEDRKILQAPDFKTIKELGLKFRGRNAWPQFRSYLPGYAPWYVTQAEAEYLTLALNQAGVVAEKYREQPDYLATRNALNDYQEFLVCVPHKRGDTLTWEETWMAPAPYESPLILPSAPDEKRLKKIAQSSARTEGILDMDYFFAPTGIRDEDDGRPWYPYFVLGVDDVSGMPLHTDLVKHGELGRQFGELFLSLAEQMQQLPAKIQVCQEQAQVLLEPIAEALDIELALVESLPPVEAVQQAFLDYL